MSDHDRVRAESLDGLDTARQTGEPVVIDLGDLVACDGCDADLTNDTRTGGFLFGSYLYGPCCAAKRLTSIRGYGEEDHITAWCPPGISCADWIRGIRNSTPGGNEIRITPGRPS